MLRLFDYSCDRLESDRNADRNKAASETGHRTASPSPPYVISGNTAAKDDIPLTPASTTPVPTELWQYKATARLMCIIAPVIP
jgi:hypothetical protein